MNPIARCLFVSAFIGSTCTLAQTVPARNNPSAVYVDGTFTLPEGLGPKQYYVIVVQKAGEKDIEMKLPEGSNMTRLVAGARPAGTWGWTYRLLPLQGASIDVLSQSGPLQAPLTMLTTPSPDKRYITVTWKHLPQAAKYRIVTRDIIRRDDGTEKIGSDNAPLAVDPLDELRDSVRGKLETILFQILVNPGQSFLWRVEAQDDKGYVIASSESLRIDIASPWYAELGKAGFSLQRAETLTVKELRKTDALVSFAQTSSEAKGSTAATHNVRAFSSEFAILWRGPNNLVASGGDVVIPTGSVEARLNSSGNAKANDVIRGRVGVSWVNNAPPFDSAGNVKWEHDRKSGIEKTMLEIAATPLNYPFAQLLPLYREDRTDVYGNVLAGKEYPVLVGFTPTAGVDFGKTTKKVEGAIENNDVLRFFGTLRVDVEIPFLSRILQVPRVSAWGTFTTRYLKNEPGDRRKDFVSSSLEFWLAPNVALTATYKVGRDSPAFDWGRSSGLGITARFN